MMRWLNNGWRIQSARVDAMSLRERIFLFAALIAGCMALADTLWLSPAQTQYQKLTRQFDTQNTELQRTRNELRSVIHPADAANGVRDEIATVMSRIASANRTIKDVSPSTTRETPLAQVLVHVLRRQQGLTLLHVSTLAPQAALTASTGAASATLPSGWLTRQGVELTVSGSYPELTRYLEMLENVLPYLRWGPMTLKSEKLPPELTLQLFLVELKP